MKNSTFKILRLVFVVVMLLIAHVISNTYNNANANNLKLKNNIQLNQINDSKISLKDSLKIYRDSINELNQNIKNLYKSKRDKLYRKNLKLQKANSIIEFQRNVIDEREFDIEELQNSLRKCEGLPDEDLD